MLATINKSRDRRLTLPSVFVSWIDNSPETLRKREAILKKERQDKGDEEREQRQIQEQIERAQLAEKNKETEAEADPEAKILQRKEGEKVKLNIDFGSSKSTAETKPKSESPDVATTIPDGAETTATAAAPSPTPASTAPPAQQPVKLSMSLGDKKPKNVFAAAAKKNPLAGKKGPVLEAPKKMSEQERIMRTEMEAMQRKRVRSESAFPGSKRPKVS